MFRQHIRLVAIAVYTHQKMAVHFLECHDHSSQCIEYELFDDPANNYMNKIDYIIIRYSFV